MEITTKCVDTGSHAYGELLEVLCWKWIQLKWYAADEGNLATFSVAKLLGIEAFVRSKSYSPLLSYFLKKTKPLELPTLYQCDVKSSYSNPSSVLSFLESIEIGDNMLAIILPSKGEAWDVCLKLQVSGSRHAYIFMDVKSKQEPTNMDSSELKITETCKSFRQSIHTGNMMRAGGLSDDYLYIYMTTHEGNTFSVNASLAPNTIVMASDTSLHFLGPLAGIYRVVRNVMMKG